MKPVLSFFLFNSGKHMNHVLAFNANSAVGRRGALMMPPKREADYQKAKRLNIPRVFTE